jgi:uncharacterized membrane protein
MRWRRLWGLFEHTSEVDRAIDELTKEGFAKNQIGIVARHDTVKRMGLTTVSGAEVGVITGATTGGIAGLLIGLGALLITGLDIVAAGTFLVIVGAAILGLAGGSITGGLVGALTGFGIEETHAKRYAAGVNEGRVLVTVQSPPERADVAAEILRRCNALEVDVTGAELPALAISSSAPAPVASR